MRSSASLPPPGVIGPCSAHELSEIDPGRLALAARLPGHKVVEGDAEGKGDPVEAPDGGLRAIGLQQAQERLAQGGLHPRHLRRLPREPRLRPVPRYPPEAYSAAERARLLEQEPGSRRAFVH